MQNSLSNAILANLLDGVLIVNRDGIIIYANKAAQALFNMEKEQLLGQDFGFPVKPFDVQEIEIVKEHRVRTVQMLATNISWDGAEACLLSLRDITELKSVTRQLEAEKLNLQRSNEDLEQYASIASHDLKEPVRKILVFADMLLNNNLAMRSAGEVKEYLNKIHQSAERMRSLLAGIAEYSKYSGGRLDFETVNLSEVVAEVLLDLELTIQQKNAKVHVEDLPTIEAVRIQMHQLFLNIIANAIKYSKKDIAPEILIRHTDLDSIVEITVSDNGIGFENDYSSKVFLPFERLHAREYEGSGIGLAICKKIVEAHGGSISVTSIPGDGSHFTFTLERQHDAAYNR